jgi:hypothetical protein
MRRIDYFLDDGPRINLGLRMLSTSGLGLLALVFIFVASLLSLALRTSALIASAFSPALGLGMAFLMAIEAFHILLFAFLALLGLGSQRLIRRSTTFDRSPIILVSDKFYDDSQSRIGAGNRGHGGNSGKGLGM